MRVTSLITRIIAFAFLALSFSTATIAQGDPTGSPAGSCVEALGVGAEGDACISVVHASPDAPNVDIYLNGEQVLGDLGFGWWSNWLAVPAGEHQVQVTAAGAS